MVLYNDMLKDYIKWPSAGWDLPLPPKPLLEIGLFSDFTWWRVKKWEWITAEPPPFNSTEFSKITFEKEFPGSKALVPVMEGRLPEYYFPHRENPAIFLEFKNIEINEKSYRDFTQRYGPLTPMSGWPVSPKDPTILKAIGIQTLERHGKDFLYGMSIKSRPSDFSRLAEWLGPLIELKEAIDQENEALCLKILNKRFRREYEQISHLNLDQAKRKLIEYVNRYLSFWRYVSAQLVINKEGNPLLNVKPHNLAGLILLQFAHSITEGKRYKPCQVCGKWIEITKDKRTHGKKYCGSTCGQRAKRAKDSKS